MEQVRSADGTEIAVFAQGEGLPIVIVNGAMSTAADAEPLAAELARHGYRGVAYDRRARGSSTDTTPYAPERETEDLAAVIESVGGDAVVLGHSSGAVLALLAASLGVPMRHAILSEPPLRFDQPAPEGLVEDLQQLVDAGRGADAVTTFQLRGVGLPAELVAQLRDAPFFPELVKIAQSTVYDATITRDVGDPTDAMVGVDIPVTLLRGERTFPFLVGASDRLAAKMPKAEYVVSSEISDHRLAPEPTARIVSEILSSD